MPIQVRSATAADSAEVAAVAAHTFPLACPASSTPENIAAFIAANLSTNNFDQYIREHRVLVARENDAIVGYAMLVDGVAEDPDVQRAVTLRPAMQLSKMYVLPEFHRAGVAGALMTAALTDAAARGAMGVWLGVNQENERAQRFYAKHGFNRSGTKTFQVGERVENDYVMQCLVAEPR
ncbi:GNAT family N-acetyltransferase [Mycobacteriaceae bacterium NPDC060252]